MKFIEKTFTCKYNSFKLFRDNNFDNINSRIKEIDEAILSKEWAIEKNIVIEETESVMFDRNTKYTAEIVQMRTRIDNLKKGDKEIKNTVKPQLLNLKREIKELSHEIINGKKKMDGIENKIQKWNQGLELAKNAYREKFNLDPENLVKSPTKNPELEYSIFGKKGKL